MALRFLAMQWVPLSGGGADLSQQILVLDGKRSRLTTKERDLLAYLAQRPKTTVTRRELLVNVWGHAGSASEEPVYSTVKRLRAKIDRGEHKHLVSVHGDGYRWEPAVDAAAKAPEARLTTLPVAGGAFVGREQELAAIERALDGGTGVVTLVGPGGAGKTRCVHELAKRRRLVFCDLAGTTSEASFLAAVAAALQVPLAGADPSSWSIGVGNALAAVGCLVVLDNLEQITDPAARAVGAWSARAPAILCTSRQPLGLAAEQVVTIGPLQRDDALRLLADRIGAEADRADELALHDAIVARVDALPLAIELAAAQARAIGARALLDSLDHPLATLVAGPRGAPARHATLRATVEWSWRLLSEPERAALTELAVFVGPFDLAAARAVLDSGDTEGLRASRRSGNAGARLAELCRRSLVLREGDRFKLFAAVRELALEHAADLEPVRERHARHLALVGEAALAELDGPNHHVAAARLGELVGELWSASDFAERGDPNLRARLALIVDRALGLQAEHATLRQAVLAGARSGPVERSLERRLLLAQGRLEGAPSELLDRALELSDAPAERAEVLLARAEQSAEDHAAQADLDLALRLVGPRGAPQLRGRILARSGERAYHRGRVDEASLALRRALALHHQASDRRAVAQTSALLAHIARLETGDGTARALLDSARAAADELGEPLLRARVLIDRGQHLTRVGDQTGARVALDEAATVYERLGFARERALIHLHVAETLIGVGDFDRALSEAMSAWAALSEDIAGSTTCEAVACVQLLREDHEEAARWLERGLSAARRNGAERSLCTLLGKRGLLHLARGDYARAWDDFDEAVRKNQARGSTAITAASLADRAMASLALGDDAAGLADLAAARALLRAPAPAPHELHGRMLIACEVLGRGFAAARAVPVSASSAREARARLEPLFRGAEREWDVVLRLVRWLLDALERRIDAAAAPR